MGDAQGIAWTAYGLPVPLPRPYHVARARHVEDPEAAGRASSVHGRQAALERLRLRNTSSGPSSCPVSLDGETRT